MKIPEIERDLRDLDPKLRYWMMRHQEEIIDLRRSLSEATKIIIQLVDQFHNLHSVNIELNRRWEKMRRGESEPEMVESVLAHPDPERNN